MAENRVKVVIEADPTGAISSLGDFRKALDLSGASAKLSDDALCKLADRFRNKLSADKAEASLERTRQQIERIGTSAGLSQKEVARLYRQLGTMPAGGGLQSVAGGSSGIAATTSALETLALKMAAVVAAYVSLREVAGFLKDSILDAARYQTLGVVLEKVGANAGYTSTQMHDFDAAVQQTGISMLDSRESLTKMATAQLDLSRAAELARVAQNAATITGENSSVTFGKLVQGITTGQTILLHHQGIMVNVNDEYKKYAKQLGIAKDALTEAEKQQALLNAVIEFGGRSANAYDSAMGTAGKQITSFKRYISDLKVVIGESFLEQFTKTVFNSADAIAKLKQTMQTPEARDAMESLANSVSMVLNKIILNTPDAVKKIVSLTDAMINWRHSFPYYFGDIGKAAVWAHDTVIGTPATQYVKTLETLQKMKTAYGGMSDGSEEKKLLGLNIQDTERNLQNLIEKERILHTISNVQKPSDAEVERLRKESDALAVKNKRLLEQNKLIDAANAIQEKNKKYESNTVEQQKAYATFQSEKRTLSQGWVAAWNSGDYDKVNEFNNAYDASVKKYQDTVSTKSQLQQSMLQQFNSFMTGFTTDLVSQGIQYGFASKSIDSGKLDCSGFVQNAYQAWFQAVGKRAESVGINTDMSDALKGSSEAIIEKVSKLTGGYLQSVVSGIDKSTLQSGMLIGLDTGSHGWDSGRKLGIDHIVEVLQDAEGKLKIAQSSSKGGGVNLMDYDKWAAQTKNATAYIVNPLQGITDKFNPTLGEMEKFQQESSKILQQTKDQNEQLTAQLGYDAVSATIAGIKKKYEREQADILEKMRTANGPVGDLQQTLATSKANEALAIRIAQQKAYQDSLKLTASLLQEVGELEGDAASLRAGREGAPGEKYDIEARTIQSSYADPAAKAQAQALSEKRLTLEFAQIRLATTQSFAEYYATFIEGLNGRNKTYQKETTSIYDKELTGYIDISKQMLRVRIAAFDQIIAYAQKTSNQELAVFAQVEKEAELLKGLQNTQKYASNPSDAFWATMSANYGTYKSDLTKDREDYVTFANSIKSLTDGIGSSIGSTLGTVVSEWSQGTLTMQDIWSSLLSSLGQAFGNFCTQILQMWINRVLSNLVSSFSSVGSGGGSLLGSLFGGASSASYGVDAAFSVASWGPLGFAHGGMFSSPTGLPLNSILASPTYFPVMDNGLHPFASGGLGLAGEAGKEAIMPIKTMSDGNLGVQAQVPQAQESTRPTTVQANLKVANFFDPGLMGAFMKTAEGEKILVNAVTRAGFKRS